MSMDVLLIMLGTCVKGLREGQSNKCDTGKGKNQIE